MKRYLLLLLALAMMVAVLAACDSAQDTTTSKAEGTTSPAPTTSTVPATTETPVSTAIPGTLSPEKRAEYLAMAEKDIERAGVIGEATIDKYGRPILGYTLAETYNPDTKVSNGTSSVWHYTSFYAMVSRLVEIAETGSTSYEEYTQLSERVYKGFKLYEGTADIVTYLGTFEKTMYGVNRAASEGKAVISGDKTVYDDQMWIIRETVYRYKQTGDQKYLDEAMRLCKICIDGWDYSLDSNGKEFGGIPWGPYYASKHTCSNAPIIAPLVEIYEILKEKNSPSADYYLEWAQKIYTYTKEKLRNGSGCYGDSTGYQRVERVGSNGKMQYVTVGTAGFDGKEYTYNTGAMISGGVALYRATGKTSYLTDAKNAARASYSTFCKTTTKDGTRVPMYPIDTQTTWFNLVLLQGYLDLYEASPNKTYESYILSFQTSLDYAYDNYLKDGFLPRDYVNGWNMDSSYDKNKNVMDQASASQMYAMLALWAEQRIAADDALLAGGQE